MSENEKKKELIYAELMNRCWEDEKYLERFRREPAAVLAEAGIPVKEGVRYHVVDQSKDKVFLVLPQDYPAEKMEKLDDLKAEIRTKVGLSEDAVIEVLQNTDTDIYLSYFPAPKFQPLSDDDLATVAAGKGHDENLYTYAENAVAIEQQVVFYMETVVDMVVLLIG